MPLVPTQGTEKMLLTWIQCCNCCRFAVDSTMKGQLWKVARRATGIRYERLLVGREVALFVDVRCRISGNDPLRWGGRSTGRKSKAHLSPGLQFELIWSPIDVRRSGYGEVAHSTEAQARRRFVPDEARKYGCISDAFLIPALRKRAPSNLTSTQTIE